MAASEARIEANRRNARKSTGPRTEAGKAASRANSYQHGLTGAGVVGSAEDREAAGRLEQSLRAELRPGSALGSVLVGRMAILAVRMDRCGRQESAAIGAKVRGAAADFEDGRADEADSLYGRLVDPEAAGDPGPLIRKLRRTPEGLERLVSGWVDLASAIRKPEVSPWGEGHLRTFEALSGHRPTDLAPSRAAMLARVVAADDASGLKTDEVATLAGLDPRGRAAWARDRLVELITEAVDELEAAYHDLDFEAIELDRAEAATRALFDPSKEATLARKYEAAAERGFYRALKEFERAEAGVDIGVMAGPPPVPVAPPAHPPQAAAARGSLASFFPDAAPVAPDPAPSPNFWPGRVMPTAEGPQAVGYARFEPGPGGIR